MDRWKHTHRSFNLKIKKKEFNNKLFLVYISKFTSLYYIASGS